MKIANFYLILLLTFTLNFQYRNPDTFLTNLGSMQYNLLINTKDFIRIYHKFVHTILFIGTFYCTFECYMWLIVFDNKFNCLILQLYFHYIIFTIIYIVEC